MNQESSSLSPQALSLAGLAVEFGKVLANATEKEPQEFLRECLRYLPRIFISACDLKIYGEDSCPVTEDFNTGAISDSVTEEQYEMVREGIAKLLGEYDVYLDTPVEDMRYSDTPVGVSLSEQLADIFQCVVDFAATMGMCDGDTATDVLSEFKYRFHSYLSETICSAQRAVNTLYQSQALLSE